MAITKVDGYISRTKEDIAQISVDLESIVVFCDDEVIPKLNKGETVRVVFTYGSKKFEFVVGKNGHINLSKIGTKDMQFWTFDHADPCNIFLEPVMGLPLIYSWSEVKSSILDELHNREEMRKALYFFQV